MMFASTRRLPALLRLPKASPSTSTLPNSPSPAGINQSPPLRWSTTTTTPPISITHTSSTSTSTSSATLTKSPDQITEEEILSLQSELRSHHRSANYTSALATAATLLDKTLGHFGKAHPATASAYNNVALMYKSLGRYEEAREAYEESLRIYGEVCGRDHGSYAAALSNLGMLERGRVLEVDDDDDDDADNYDDTTTTASKPQKLSALDRLQLNEVAIEYFDEAYRIRLAELGPTHPHTLSSRSQLGSAMAHAVLMERRNILYSSSSSSSPRGLIEKELRNMKHTHNIEERERLERHVPAAIGRAAKKSMGMSSLSKRRWDAAREHLRGALEGSVNDPRGESVTRALEYITNSGAAGAGGSGHVGVYVKDRSLSKKDRKKAAKEARREKRQANANALSGESNGITAIQGAAAKVTTLSAATAAQNLAVFLKNYSDWLQLTLMDDDTSSDSSQQQREQRLLEVTKSMREARHLYEAALHVRSQLLPLHHPDVVATKFSLAELLDAPKDGVLAKLGMGVEGDSERANALREEILAAYNVEERDEDVAAVSK